MATETPTSYLGPRRFWVPPRRTLAVLQAAGGPGGSVFFRVDVPDSRIRVKVSLVGVPAAGGAENFLAGKGATLWLAEIEDDQSGTSGIMIPCVDLEGSSSAPTAIPTDANLGGYSREFVTSADAIRGRLFLPVQLAGGAPGSVILQTRFQPDSVSFGFEEWDEIRRACKAELVGPKVVT